MGLILMSQVQVLDLTQRPPRSLRTRIGGYALFARMLDKGRATLAGNVGDFHFACPMDQRFLEFVGVDADELLKVLATGAGDGEMLEWVKANAKYPRTEWEISQWSHFQETRVPTDIESRQFFQKLHTGAGPDRKDIATWADLLDLDDFVSYGGKA